MCGVPYGEIDVDRLTNSLVLVDDPETGRRSLGVQEKALSALESLLFAKYQMYRNVYWHHAVRSATAMYKRLVEDAVRADVVGVESLARYTDEGLMHRLESERPTPLLSALKERDRKSTRLNSSHPSISYAVFCLKKKKNKCSEFYLYNRRLEL